MFVALWEEAGISICEWLAHSIPFRRPPYCSTSVWEPRLWLNDNSGGWLKMNKPTRDLQTMGYPGRYLRSTIDPTT